MSHKPIPYVFWWLLIAAMFCALPLMAATIERPLPDATQESRARALFGELRCVVCAGQSIADSDTTLATQMRAHVREMVGEGNTDAQVLEYFTDHYGVSVRMSPPLHGDGAWIWAIPLLLLALGAGVLWHTQRGRA